MTEKPSIKHPSKDTSKTSDGSFWDGYHQYKLESDSGMSPLDIMNYILMHAHNKTLSFQQLKFIIVMVNEANFRNTGKNLAKMNIISRKDSHYIEIRELSYIRNNYKIEFIYDMSPIARSTKSLGEVINSLFDKPQKLILQEYFHGGMLTDHELHNIIIDELLGMSLREMVFRYTLKQKGILL